MRLPHHLLRHPSGIFHFRLIVPLDLRERIGLRVVKKSLRTRDPKTAALFAWSLSAAYARAFATYRDLDMAKPPSIDDVLASLSGGNAKRYEIDAVRGVVKADGEEDHRRAMEMMEAAARLAAAQAEAQRLAPAVPVAPAAPVGPRAPSGYTMEQAIALWEELGHG